LIFFYILRKRGGRTSDDRLAIFSDGAPEADEVPKTIVFRKQQKHQLTQDHFQSQQGE
jgi:hypothetical protein